MRRFLWLLLLPVVWAPLVVLVLAVGTRLPWFAWAFGAVFVVLWRRRRSGGGTDAAGGEPLDGPRWSPTRSVGL